MQENIAVAKTDTLFPAQQLQVENFAVAKDSQQNIQRVREKLGDIPINAEISPMPIEEFNPKYLEAMASIFTFIATQYPDEHLDPETMLAEYIRQYGLVTEQDHIDCLKLALREALEYIAQGKKICVLTHGEILAKRSQKLMSQALYTLIAEVAGNEVVSLTNYTSSPEEIRQMIEKDGLTGNDYRFVAIDDARYSGVQFDGILERVLRNLKEIVAQPALSIDAYLAYNKFETPFPDLAEINTKIIRRRPPPSPPNQLRFFYQYIYDIRNNEKQRVTDLPQIVLTAYKNPDPHSIPHFYKQWGSFNGANGSTGAHRDAQQKISFLERILEKNDQLRKYSHISAFRPKSYPSVESLVDKVRQQIY